MKVLREDPPIKTSREPDQIDRFLIRAYHFSGKTAPGFLQATAYKKPGTVFPTSYKKPRAVFSTAYKKPGAVFQTTYKPRGCFSCFSYL